MSYMSFFAITEDTKVVWHSWSAFVRKGMGSGEGGPIAWATSRFPGGTQKEKESGVPPERFGGTDTGQADLESLDPVSKKKGSPGLGLDCLGLSMWSLSSRSYDLL